MVKPRISDELKLMRKSGKITASVLKKVLDNIKIGISGLELNEIAEGEIKHLGGEASFKTVKGYKWAICISINEQVVHGIPTQLKVKEGDIVSIDLGVIYKSWHTDAAWTVLVNQKPSIKGHEDKEQFLEVGKQALWEGVDQAVDGKRIGDISEAIQKRVEGSGYSVVRSLVGHGIGKNLHEEPEIPGYGQANTGLVLKMGMSLAIEVIFTMGKPEVVLEHDGWTIKSADGSLAGLFEMTVVVGATRPEVLTYWKGI